VAPDCILNMSEQSCGLWSHFWLVVMRGVVGVPREVGVVGEGGFGGHRLGLEIIMLPTL